jgi:hypothetical protein
MGVNHHSRPNGFFPDGLVLCGKKNVDPNLFPTSPLRANETFFRELAIGAFLQNRPVPG